MFRIRVPVIASIMIITIAACSRQQPVANDVKAVNLSTAQPHAVQDPLGGPPVNAESDEAQPSPSPASGATAVVIPAALQGRWGLSPADCTSSRGDAKGLLLVNGSELRFYESRAVPSPGVQTDRNSVTGTFQFTGEGQSWTKFETLERKNDTLVRTESNPAASYTYAKC